MTLGNTYTSICLSMDRPSEPKWCKQAVLRLLLGSESFGDQDSGEGNVKVRKCLEKHIFLGPKTHFLWSEQIEVYISCRSDWSFCSSSFSASWGNWSPERRQNLPKFSQNSPDFKIRPLCQVCWMMRMVVVTITAVAVICYGLEQGSATSFLEGKGTGSKYFRLCRADDLSGTCR